MTKQELFENLFLILVTKFKAGWILGKGKLIKIIKYYTLCREEKFTLYIYFLLHTFGIKEIRIIGLILRYFSVKSDIQEFFSN